jgi:hypothetical protein
MTTLQEVRQLPLVESVEYRTRYSWSDREYPVVTTLPGAYDDQEHLKVLLGGINVVHDDGNELWLSPDNPTN